MKLNPTTHQTDPRTDHTPLCLSPVLARELGDGLLERRERDVGRGAPHLGSVAAEVRGVELRARLRQRVEVLRGRERLGRRQAHEGGRQQQVVRDGAHEEGGEEGRRLRVRRRGRGWGAAEGGEEARRSAAVRRLRVVEGEVVDAVQQDLEPAGELDAREVLAEEEREQLRDQLAVVVLALHPHLDPDAHEEVLLRPALKVMAAHREARAR